MTNTRIYYGWWIVGAAFLILFVCAGIGFSTFPVFLKYLEADMHWSRTSISLASGIAARSEPDSSGSYERYLP